MDAQTNKCLDEGWLDLTCCWRVCMTWPTEVQSIPHYLPDRTHLPLQVSCWAGSAQLSFNIVLRSLLIIPQVRFITQKRTSVRLMGKIMLSPQGFRQLFFNSLSWENRSRLLLYTSGINGKSRAPFWSMATTRLALTLCFYHVLLTYQSYFITQ